MSHTTGYGSKEKLEYTSLVDQIRERGLPGPVAPAWPSLCRKTDTVIGATDEVEAAAARVLMTRVARSKGPIWVRQDGTLNWDEEKRTAVRYAGEIVFEGQECEPEVVSSCCVLSP